MFDSPINPLRLTLAGDTADLVDQLLDGFVLDCMGKNDMVVINALLASAALLIVTHCQRTGQDFNETFSACRQLFDMAGRIANGT
jgi:hypothetical protein